MYYSTILHNLYQYKKNLEKLLIFIENSMLDDINAKISTYKFPKEKNEKQISKI